MVTTAGGTGLLTGWDVFSTDGPLGRSPRSPSTPQHSNVLQTGPLAGAQLEGNDIFGVDVFRRAGSGGLGSEREGNRNRTGSGI